MSNQLCCAPLAAPPAPPAASPAEMDLFSAFSDSVSPNSLALVPVTTTTEPDASVDSGFGSTFVPLSSASAVLNQVCSAVINLEFMEEHGRVPYSNLALLT